MGDSNETGRLGYVTGEGGYLTEEGVYITKEGMMVSEKPSFWPENPYSETIFPMQRERYAEIVPDPDTRTALSGMLGREFWEIASEAILDRYNEAVAELEAENAAMAAQAAALVEALKNTATWVKRDDMWRCFKCNQIKGHGHYRDCPVKEKLDMLDNLPAAAQSIQARLKADDWMAILLEDDLRGQQPDEDSMVEAEKRQALAAYRKTKESQ